MEALAADSTGAFFLTGDLLVNSKFDISTLPADTHTIVVDAGTVAILTGFNSALPNVVILPNSGVDITIGTRVGDITTATAAGDSINNIVVQGTAKSIVVTAGTHIEGIPYKYITAGAYNSGTVEGNIILEDGVTAHLSKDSYVGIGAYNNGAVLGDILIGNNVTVTSTTEGNVKTAIGASSNSRIHDIIVGSNITMDITTNNASAVIGVQASTGNDVVVGPNAQIRFTKPPVYSGGQAVAIGAAGYYGGPGKLNNVTMLSNTEPTPYYNLDIYQGVGVGVYNEGTVNNVTIGDNLRFYSSSDGGVAPTMLGISAPFSPVSAIEGNLVVGNNIEIDSLKLLDTGIGANSSKIKGNITIGDNLILRQTLFGVGSLASNGTASVGKITIGNNATITSNILAVGAYMGYTSYGAQTDAITIGRNAKITSASTGVGVFGSKGTTGTDITIGAGSEITSGRLGVGAVNGALLNGNITIGENTTIRSNANSPAFVGVGVGKEERILAYTGQKVNGNIVLQGNLAIYYNAELAGYPFVNLLGNDTGTITIQQGNIYAAPYSDNKAVAVSFDRSPINQYGEALSPYAIPYQSTQYNFTVPATGTLAAYTYTASPAWSGEAANNNSSMVVYLPARTLVSTDTFPKQTAGKFEEVSDWIAVTFNASVDGAMNINDDTNRYITLHFFEDGSTEATIFLNQENFDAGIYSFTAPSGITKENTLYINLTKLTLTKNQNYFAQILTGTMQDSIGYMQQTEDIKWNFRLVDAPPVPPASSSSQPASSSSQPASSSSQPTSSSSQPASSSSQAASSSNQPASSSSQPASSSSQPASSSSQPASSSSQPASSSSQPASSSSQAASSSSRPASSSSRPANSSSSGSSAATSSANSNTAGTASASSSSKGTSSSISAASSMAEVESQNQETLSQLIDDGVPTFSIGNNDIPLFGSALKTWSLINLLVAIAGIITSVVVSALLLIKKNRSPLSNTATTKSFFYSIGGIIFGFTALITFFIVEKISYLMVLFNQWTPLMLLLLGLQLAAFYMARRAQRHEENENQETV